ncbi:MAG: hypothetical protein MK209_06480, partial [Planctomycetes bacterium]|nr:hypothetical protein [Planctomycetota bacterium]
ATVTEGEVTTVDIIDVSAGGCQLNGRLTKNGVPVSGAMLSSIAMGGSGMFDFRMATARTDENGLFTFKSLAPGEYALNVESSEWRGQLDLFVDDMPEDYVELRVPETLVTGRITSATSGMPLAGVRVRMVREDSPGGMAGMFGGGSWRTRANTDDQGIFSIEGASPGDYHLIVEPETFGDFDPETGEIEGKSDTSYRKTKSKSFFLDEDERYEVDEIQLEAAGAIVVTVTDQEGKKLERGFTMKAVPVGNTNDGETFDSWGWNGSGTLAGVPAGTYRFSLEARGFATQVRTISVTAGGITQLEMQLESGVELSVKVMGLDGRPNNSALVTLYNGQDEVVYQDNGNEEASVFRNFFGGGGDGTRGIGSFAPGRYRVVATDGNRNGDTWVTLEAGQAQIATVRL